MRNAGPQYEERLMRKREPVSNTVINAEPVHAADGRELLEEHQQELFQRWSGPLLHDQTEAPAANTGLVPPGGLFLLARVNGSPAGCIGIRALPQKSARSSACSCALRSAGVQAPPEPRPAPQPVHPNRRVPVAGGHPARRTAARPSVTMLAGSSPRARPRPPVPPQERDEAPANCISSSSEHR